MAKWNDELLRESIFDAMLILNIKRMPTHGELIKINRINEKATGMALANAINAKGGFLAIANELKLQRK